MKKVINYSMTRNYRKEWDIVDAIRELAQNCLDNNECASSYNVFEDGVVNITTKGYRLPREALALGYSDKDENSIGGFGEGFKMAMLVLTREGCDPIAISGNDSFKPGFELDEFMQEETFNITVEDREFHDGLTYSLIIPVELIPDLKRKVTVFSNNPLPKPRAGTVDVLEDRPGDVFVSGLFVCHEPKFKFGYNFAPDMIELGCDRKIASSLGMAWETSKVWADRTSEENKDDVLQMLTEEHLDVSDFSFRADTKTAEIIASAFTERFGHVKIKKVGSTLSHGVSVCGCLYNTMVKSGNMEVAKDELNPIEPIDIMKKFYEDNKKHMRRTAKVEFLKVIDKASNWSKGPF